MDWPVILRRVERKQRLVRRSGHVGNRAPSWDYYARATYASFRMEGLEVTREEVEHALGHGLERPAIRSRQGQRLRNHAAILHHVENNVRQGLPLTTDGVVRWYTTISAGLSTTGLGAMATARLEDVVRRINSPQLRMQAAVREIAAGYAKLLADPLVPGFNGILARLLLRYHLGRCQLPAVVFDPGVDGRLTGGEGMVRRIVELLEQSYDEALGKKR